MPSPRKKSRYPSNPSKKMALSSVHLSIFLGMLASLVVAFTLIWFYWLRQTGPLPKNADKKTTKQPTEIVAVIKPNTDIYDFYQHKKIGDKPALFEEPLTNAANESNFSGQINPKPWFLQVAAFQQSAAANQLLAMLRLKGISNVAIYYERFDSFGNWLYQVRVGPYFDKSAAENAYEQLQQSGITSTIL